MRVKLSGKFCSVYILMLTFLFVGIEIAAQTPTPVQGGNCLVELVEYSDKWTLFQCGDEFIATRSDGTKWKCKCACDISDTDGRNCVQLNADGSGQGVGSVPSTPSQADLNAYYNSQWTGYLYEQADLEFKKGLELFNKGNCAKAIKRFENAGKFADLEIYDDYLTAAKYCRDTQLVNARNKSVKPYAMNVVRLSKADSAAHVYAEEQQKLMQTVPDLIHLQVWGDLYMRRDYEKNVKVEETKEQLSLALQLNRKPSKSTPKKLSDLNPGDVILVGPDEKSFWSKGQAYTDAMVIDANAYVTHTLTCVKIIETDGVKKRIFMDNQGTEGPRLISEAEFERKYYGRSKSVASMKDEPFGVATPVNEKEADSIWQMARRLVQKNKDNENGWMGKNNYGFWGDDQIVCSEASWMLVNVTGRYKIPVSNTLLSKTAGMDYTPASFFKDTKYFLINKFENDPKEGNK